MTDMILHHVDSLLTERIRSLAKERQCSVNEVMLRALRNGLGMSVAQEFSESSRDSESLADLDGDWEAAEQRIFREAISALAQARATQFAPENLLYKARVSGAE
jgi:hypothetical protein